MVQDWSRVGSNWARNRRRRALTRASTCAPGPPVAGRAVKHEDRPQGRRVPAAGFYIAPVRWACYLAAVMCERHRGVAQDLGDHLHVDPDRQGPGGHAVPLAAVPAADRPAAAAARTAG